MRPGGNAEAFVETLRHSKGIRSLSGDVEQDLWEKWVMLATGAAVTCPMLASIGRSRNFDHAQLSDEPDPAPERGGVEVRVSHVPLNYRDIAIARGNYIHPLVHGLNPRSEASSVVTSVAVDGHTLKARDPDISVCRPTWFGGRERNVAPSSSYGNGADGWLAERKIVSQEALMKLPDGISSVHPAVRCCPCIERAEWRQPRNARRINLRDANCRKQWARVSS